MKKITYLVCLAMAVSLSVSAQHAIKANHVTNHVGENVVVVDSIYDMKIYNDSTAVINLGAKGALAPLNVIFNFTSNSSFDPGLLKSCNGSLLEVHGMVVLISNRPSIVVTNKDNLYFFAHHPDKSWPALSQLTYKTN